MGKVKANNFNHTILSYSKPFIAFAPALDFLLFSVHLIPAWSIDIYPAHFFWSLPRPLSVIPSPLSHPALQLIPLPSGRRWTATERTESARPRRREKMIEGDTAKQTGMKGEWTEETGQRRVMTQTRTAEQDRQASCEAGTTTCNNTHIFKRTLGGTMDSALQLNYPPLTNQSSLGHINYLCYFPFHPLNPHVSVDSFLCFALILSSTLSSPPPPFQQAGCSLVAYPVY